MADYWKSIEKKYCNFCRTWITNNKASVQFHERGRKHKSNVEKKLKFLTRQKNRPDETTEENAEILARLDKDDSLLNKKQENPELLIEPVPEEAVPANEPEPVTSSTYNPDYVQSLVKAKMTWEVVGVTDIVEDEQPKKRLKTNNDKTSKKSSNDDKNESSDDNDDDDDGGEKEPVFVVKEKVLETSSEAGSSGQGSSFAFKKHKFNKKNIRGRQSFD